MGFALEFHLPYLALRQAGSAADTRGLRETKRMPGTMDTVEPEILYHEAQVSFLLVGVDEWFWTVYCCVDTFFGSERDAQWYKEYGFDACSGAGRMINEPVWNPREYFLIVLNRRLAQVAKEWTNAVSILEGRLASYVLIPSANGQG
jgi:hypothetical protein